MHCTILSFTGHEAYKWNKEEHSCASLLQENETVTDIERLDRDEFIIDVPRKDQVQAEGEKECNEIKKEAEKTVLRL